MRSSLNEIFSLPLPLGTRPKRLTAGNAVAAILWNEEALPIWLPYKIHLATGSIEALSTHPADNLTVINDVVYWWRGCCLRTDLGVTLELSNPVLDVQRCGDDHLLIITAKALLITPNSLSESISTIWTGNDGEQPLASVRQTDADTRTLSDPDAFVLAASKGEHVAIVGATDDSTASVFTVDFCADPTNIQVSSRSRTWVEDVSVWSREGESLTHLSVAYGFRTLNVFWFDRNLIVDVLRDDDVTRELLSLTPGLDEPAVIWRERVLPWHTSAGRQSGTMDDRIWIVSEQSGIARLYEIQNGTLTSLTPLDHEVKRVVPVAEMGYLISIARSGTSSASLEMLDGETTLSIAPGLIHDFIVTKGRVLLWVESTVTSGWSLRSSQRLNDKTSTPTSVTPRTVMPLLEIEPEFISFPGPRGSLEGMLFSGDEVKRPVRAGVIFLHGNGYLQDVLAGQHPFYWREHLYLRHLAERGVLAMTFDYAGSEGYGSRFASSVTGQVPEIELQDLAAARDELVRRGCDESRIGIFGGSYAGYLVLAALLREPGRYACGAALRAVTDWAPYYNCDPIFVRQRFGRDVTSIEYRQAELMRLAPALRDRLFIAQGAMDDNVPLQQAVLLLEALIRAGTSTCADLMIYPTERHGFLSGEAWLDEYIRIDRLFLDTLGLT